MSGFFLCVLFSRLGIWPILGRGKGKKKMRKKRKKVKRGKNKKGFGGLSGVFVCWWCLGRFWQPHSGRRGMLFGGGGSRGDYLQYVGPGGNVRGPAAQTAGGIL